jgi:hypothetical protein
MKLTFKLSLFILVLAIGTLACSLGSSEGNILYEDDFSNDSSGWDVYSDEDGATEYYEGVYRITVNTESMFYWANPYQNFEDVIIEVTASKSTGGDDMQYGIICKHTDIDNWYALIITADGYAAIRKRYQGSDLDFITDFVEAPMVNTGRATNSLRAECVGSRLALYVNGELAIETNDSDLTGGDAGLMVGTFEQPFAEALFDNFVVRKP